MGCRIDAGSVRTGLDHHVPPSAAPEINTATGFAATRRWTDGHRAVSGQQHGHEKR